MNNPTEKEDMSNAVWQSQALEAPRMSLSYIRHQAEKLNSDARREVLAAYLGSALSAVLGLVVFLSPPDQASASFVLVVQVSALLLLFSAGYVTLQVSRRNRVQHAHEHAEPVHSLQAYRTELQRRRDYYFGVWRWSLWPFVPVTAVVFVGEILYDERPGKWLRLGVVASWIVLGSLLGHWIYRRKGTVLQRELDALTTADEK